ncbi:Serine-type D-Ala-D-Ala carboxypeptidase [Altererythrobacter insulae]|nr:Serine-type D-Ala-D-Ala carboxypeptidase [Altererythrobacter insulae]
MRLFLTLLASTLCAALSSQVSAQASPSVPAQEDVPIAMLVDLSSGQILHQRNADRRFMPASITKVMTSYVAFEMLERGHLQLNETFRFNRSAFEEWGGRGSTMFLNANARPRVVDLLLGITTVSANDASVVLAEGAAGSYAGWLELMNAEAENLGMTNSHFGTPNGWPDEGRTFTTARDLVSLGTALVYNHPERYRRFYGHREFTYRGITQPNYEPFTGRIEGGDGIKTGFTNEAGFGVLGSAERAGRRLMLVVAGAPNNRLRSQAAREYMEWGFASFDSRRLYAPGETVGQARVQGGSARHIGLMTPRVIAAAIPKGAQRDISISVVYDGPVRAPIAAGEQIAELEIKVAGMETSRVPLYAADAVSKAGPFARVVNGIIGWFT